MANSKESNSAKRSTRETRKPKGKAAAAKSKVANYLKVDDTLAPGQMLKQAANRMIGRK